MRVLDLGCGSGKSLAHLGVAESEKIVSCDIEPLQVAARNFPSRQFVQAAGEALPFRAESFESVLCMLSLPYMNIPVALKEAHRVLRPNGKLFVSIHPLRFTLRELAACRSIPAILFRLFVILNGCYFHVTGRILSVRGRPESFQTIRGMRIALSRAKLENLQVDRPIAEWGKRLRITADKSSTLVTHDPKRLQGEACPAH
jgi:SAM-dependent methyltransferase